MAATMAEGNDASTVAVGDSLHVAATAEFDAYAQQYEASLQQGLRASGEGPEYFARRRLEWTARLWNQRGDRAAEVLDFGCGVGIAAALLHETFPHATVWGFDPSSAAIERATREHGDARTCFCSDPTELPPGTFDLAYCNGVFHHIPPAERRAALEIVWRSLRPGGWFAFWENNPWNPGTRYVMSRIPFDREAVTITPPESRRLLSAAGFRVLRTDAWFLFPRSLRWLRPLESLVHRLPLGGQYLTLAEKPR